MPAVVACPKCQKKYQLHDHILGKSIKCKSCGTVIQTKSPSKAPAPVSRPVTKTAAGNSTSAGTAVPTRKLPSPSELAQFGIDGPLRRQPDVFAGMAPISRQGPDVLGNHAAEPGFGEADSKRRSKAIVEDEIPTINQAEFLTNPALRQDPKKKNNLGGDSRKSKSEPWYQRVWILAMIVFPALLLGMLLLMWAVPSTSTAALIVYCTLVSATMTGVAVWNLIECARSADNTVQIIMILLVPFYVIYFWVKKWDHVWRSTMAYLVLSLFVVPISFLMILVFAYLAGPADILGVPWNK